MSRLARIAFASREVWPFVEGGGLGRAVWACAGLLASHADVTVVTSSEHRRRHEELVAAGDPRLPVGVRFAFADEPGDDVAPWRSWHHAWSGALLEAIVAAHPDGMPDLIEVPDYLAEGVVIAEARRTGDPRLQDTLVLNRIHTTFEIAAAVNRQADEPGWPLLRGLERAALHGADRLVWPGGDVLGTYERYYGVEALTRPGCIDLAFTPAEDEPAMREVPEGPLRVLYFGRLEWRKGVHHLVQAVRELPDVDLQVTLLGRDTPTGPGGGSVRAYLDGLIDGDERIVFHDQVPQERIGEFIRSHHLVVAPSLWESWSNVVREALMYNRPVLATPVGAMTSVVQPGRSGWLTADTGHRALRLQLAAIVAAREELDALIREGAPREFLDRCLDEDSIVAAYLALADEAQSHRPAPAAPPVTLVVSCRRTERSRLAATLSSLTRQTLPARVVLVCDSVATLPSVGLLEHVTDMLEVPGGPDFHLRARRAALSRVANGAIAFLEPGDELAPSFVERARGGLERAVYVTALGGLPAVPVGNVALGHVGEPAAVALYRRDALDFELPEAEDGLHEDQALIIALRSRGRFGAVIPEPLLTATAPRRRRGRLTPVEDRRADPPADLWLAPWHEGDAHPRETAARTAVLRSE